MAYRLEELKAQVPGVAGDEARKSVPSHSPSTQARLTRQLDINEGFLREPGAASLRTQRALAETAMLEIRRGEQAQAPGIADSTRNVGPVQVN